MIGPYQVEAEIEAAFSLLAFVLLCIPLYWQFGGTSSNLLTHSRLRLTILYVYRRSVSNIGCVLYIFWVGTQNLIQGVDTIIWRNNAENVAPVYCDISEHAASCLYVFWHTANVARSHTLHHRVEHRNLYCIPRYQSSTVSYRHYVYAGIDNPCG